MWGVFSIDSPPLSGRGGTFLVNGKRRGGGTAPGGLQHATMGLNLESSMIVMPMGKNDSMDDVTHGISLRGHAPPSQTTTHLTHAGLFLPIPGMTLGLHLTKSLDGAMSGCPLSCL